LKAASLIVEEGSQKENNLEIRLLTQLCDPQAAGANAEPDLPDARQREIQDCWLQAESKISHVNSFSKTHKPWQWRRPSPSCKRKLFNKVPEPKPGVCQCHTSGSNRNETLLLPMNFKAS
jgi:hypothetical protein